MIDVNCGDKVKGDDRFGPVFAGKPSYNFYIVRCPANCEKSGNVNVYGQYIHPEESGICKSALVDNAIPLSGGVIGIGIGVGLPKYPGRPEKYGMTVVEHMDSAKSYYVFKIDNIDMAVKDIRIVDHNGFIAPKGRVEFRQNGVWGSVCNKNIQDSAVKMMCVTLGFKDGKKLNPADDSVTGFCKEVDGPNNYCAAEKAPILY